MKNNKEKGFVLWFTGLPCSGKTTVADRVAVKLKEEGLKIERLDGDIVRESLTSDLGFSKEDRDENITRIMFVSKLLSRNGVGVITTFVSPYQKTRSKVRKETTNFIEVFVDCPPAECEKRDVKGMY
jgi:adenylyl-sulfate kinase